MTRRQSWLHRAKGLLLGVFLIAVVSAFVALLKQWVPTLSLTGLYLFAIFPVAIGWGIWVAGLVAVGSYVTFGFFFIAPLHSFEVADSDDVAGLLISLVVAYVVSELGRRAHERALEAGLRAEEAEQARNEVQALAEEQAALRRVATLVAEEQPTAQIFEAVVREVARHCGADLARLERFEPDGAVMAIAAWSRSGQPELAVRQPFELEGPSIAAQVSATGRPARVDTFEGASGPIAAEAQALGIRSSVGCPVMVGGRAWGVVAASTRAAPFAPDTEARIADFTELVATAVSNTDARRDVFASRARLLAAADEARRSVVRDLHDGAQQSLVQAIMSLRAAEQVLDEGDDEARALVGEAISGAEQANTELRDLARGILPPVLAHGGLAAGVRALVSRMSLPVSVEVLRERFPAPVEASAYFVVAEALTNVAKHSGARNARVAAWAEEGALRIDVRDDGVGGARPDGSGLLGLHDRLEAVGGALQVESAAGAGTRVAATVPLPH